MKNNTVLQEWRKLISSEVEMAIIYYHLLSVVNGLKLTNREIELLAFTACRGTISSPTAKGEFCRKFSSSVATINNMISRLTKRNYLSKTNGKICVNQLIDFNFSADFIIKIQLNGHTTGDNKADGGE